MLHKSERRALGKSWWCLSCSPTLGERAIPTGDSSRGNVSVCIVPKSDSEIRIPA